MENLQLLEKIGETKTDKLIQDCYKIYREGFDKLFPEYFDNNLVKSISFVTTHDKDSSEIKKIGMSCPDDLLVKQFAQWFSGLIGGSNGANPDPIRNTSNQTFGLGNSHGGSNFSCWGTRINNDPTGMILRIGNGITPPFKNAFVAPDMFRSMITTDGTFVSGLGQVTWAGQNTVTGDDTIRQTAVYGHWKLGGSGLVSDYMLSWDVINPFVNVFTSETVNVEYKLVFS